MAAILIEADPLTWKKLLLGLVLSAVLAFAGAVALGWDFMSPFRQRTDAFALTGVVETQEVRLGSKIGGRVEKVAVEEGQEVQGGDPLVYFAVPEMEAQRDQLQARVMAMQSELEKTKNGSRPEEIRAAEEAAKALRAKWDLLKAGARKEEIQEARSQLDSAEADLKLAREEFERAERLARQNSLSRSEHDTARANRERALGQSAKAKARYEMLVAGSRVEEVQQAKAEYDRAQATFELWKAGSRSEDIVAAEARLAEARGKLREIEANLQEAIVRAPERVTVEVLSVRKGDLVSPNQPVIKVLRKDDLWVKIYIPEPQMGRVKLNQEVTVSIDSDPNIRFQGQVRYIASESEFTPRNVQSADDLSRTEKLAKT